MPATALITGASRGIGKAIALQLSRDGFQVALNDIPSQQDRLEEACVEISELGGEAMACVADVSVEGEVEGMINQVVERMGSLDVMVANAGIMSSSPFIDTTVEEFTRIFSVNTLGAFLCYKHAARQMIKQGQGGRIIGATSVAGKRGRAELSAYTASKFSIRGMTQVAALELRQHGITVNAYAPGPIRTEMSNSLFKGPGSTNNEAPGRDNATLELLAHAGEPEDVAALVSFLASKSSGHITGQSVSINGGIFFD